MNKIANIVIKHKTLVVIVFIVIATVCAAASLLMSVNYNLVDYLPEDAQSTKAIEIMKEEFGGELPNARVMIHDVTVSEALAYKEKLLSVDGVTSVTWLDDVVGSEALSSTPIAYMDQAIVENYYKDDSALLTLTIQSGTEKTTVANIRTVIGANNAVGGDAVNNATTQEMSSSEVIKAMLILVPIIIIILLLSTNSWLEPLLFLAAIGAAVLINMGTNIFFGEMSFITQTVSPILQMAVSLDYAIFLLHSFGEFRKDHPPKEAMALAIKKSVSAVAASAATTVVGFLALLFMRFGVGADLGINLVKGVILSFISVMIFLPALTLACYKLLEKTRHRSFVPNFGHIGKFITKITVPFLILAVVISVPCFLAQSNIDFMYGSGSITEATTAGQDEAAIEDVFGSSNALVLLVPKSDVGREADLSTTLGNIENVSSVISYATAVGSVIPTEYLSSDITDQFYSKNYARIIIYTDMAAEGNASFTTVQNVLDTAGSYYDNYWLAGQSATLYDMSNVVSVDTTTVNIIAIIGIILILLITFKSPIMPFLLVFTIESAIWLNLSFAYFSGNSFNFIGYLVISTVQLGATVDYAILITDRFIHNRQTLPKKQALQKTLGENLDAILISALIMSTAGFTLALTSSNMIISQLGTLLGRGTVLSFLMVALVLPGLLLLFDRPLQKTKFRFGKSRGNKN